MCTHVSYHWFFLSYLYYLRHVHSVSASITYILSRADKLKSKPSFDSKKEKDGKPHHIAAQTFTFKELASATKNFRPECLIGEGGFGSVYKGRLENTGQVTLAFFTLHGFKGVFDTILISKGNGPIMIT